MYDRILVGIDGSEGAQRALAYAVELASAVDATLHVLTVVDPQGSRVFGVESVSAIDEAATELIDSVSEQLTDQDVEIVGDVRRGSPAECLLEYADETDIDLLITGQQGHSSLADRLIGSTPDRIARMTTRPFLIVPTDASRAT